MKQEELFSRVRENNSTVIEEQAALTLLPEDVRKAMEYWLNSEVFKNEVVVDGVKPIYDSSDESYSYQITFWEKRSDIVGEESE